MSCKGNVSAGNMAELSGDVSAAAADPFTFSSAFTTPAYLFLQQFGDDVPV